MFTLIGKDCEDIIYDYKKQFEEYEENINKIQKVYDSEFDCEEENFTFNLYDFIKNYNEKHYY